MEGELFNEIFQEIDCLLFENFICFNHRIFLSFQLFPLLEIILIYRLGFAELLLDYFFPLINGSLALIEPSPALQLESKIEFLIEFDPGQHCSSHMGIFPIDIFDHHVLALLLSKSIRPLIYFLFLAVEICLELQKFFLALVDFELVQIDVSFGVSGPLPKRVENGGKMLNFFIVGGSVLIDIFKNLLNDGFIFGLTYFCVDGEHPFGLI